MKRKLESLLRARKDRRISGQAFVLGCSLLTFADFEDGSSFPGRKRLCDLSGMTDRNVTKALRELERSGLIETTARPGRANIYTFIPPSPEDTPPPSREDGGHEKTPPSPEDTHPRHEKTRHPRRQKTPITINNVLLNVGDLLQGLDLYKNDKRLVQKLPELFKAWTPLYSEAFIRTEIKKAHAWEVANSSRRKKDRPKFLTSWLARAAKDLPPKKTPDLEPESVEDVRLRNERELAESQAALAAEQAARGGR